MKNRPRKTRAFQSPDHMYDIYIKWKKWVISQTIDVEVPVFNRETGSALTLKKPMPVTIESFCQFAGIAETTFCKIAKHQDFQDQLKKIEYPELKKNSCEKNINTTNNYTNKKKESNNNKDNYYSNDQYADNEDSIPNAHEGMEDGEREETGTTYEEVARKIKEFVIHTTIERQQLGIISDSSAKFYLVNNSRYQDVSRVEHEVSAKARPVWLSVDKAKAKQIDSENAEFEELN